MAELTPEEQLRRLHAGLNKDTRHLMRVDAYLEGIQPLKFINPSQWQEMNNKLIPLVINWPQLTVDAYEPRLNIEGFLLPGEVDADASMWRMWLDNKMKLGAQQAHLEAVGLGRAFAVVGANEAEPETPVMTSEHPLEAYSVDDPRTKQTEAGLKRWKDQENTSHSTLYLENDTRFYVRGRRGWEERLDERIEHGWGVVPMVPLVNRQRLLRQHGQSEFTAILPLADGVNKLATDMMVSAEYHAMPRRWAFGLASSDFVDANGRQLSTWEQVAGRMWSTAANPKDVAVGQFAEADLSNFHGSIKLLAQLASQLLALPPNFMSFTGDNPTSADAIRAGETQLVTRAERKQTGFGDSWQQVMWIALKISGADEELLKAARRMEIVWRDAATPTVSQKFDAVTKAVSAGILPREGAWDELGYSPQRKERLREQFESQQKFELEGVFPAKDVPDPVPQPEPIAA